MWNILLGRKLETFKVERSGTVIGTYQGECGIERNHNFIDFFKKLDIQQGDILIDAQTETRYYVTNVIYHTPKRIPYDGGLKDISFKVFYTPEYNIKSEPSVYINNSIVDSPNSSLNINSYNTIESEVEKCSKEDKELLKELLNVLKEYDLGKKKPEKGGLKKFESVILQYAPIALSLGQFLTQLLIRWLFNSYYHFSRCQYYFFKLP